MIGRYSLIFFVLGFFLIISGSLLATHNRAGQITYVHVEGFTYEVTILTCTDISSPNNADRPYMPIVWGDGSPADSIQRIGNGTIITPFVVKENRYVKQHTFPGPGTYSLYSEDPNRNGGINNIPNSIDVIFSITSVLVISADTEFGAFNNSVQLLNAPKDDACSNALWLHNPVAVDPDGDSLAYELIPCTGAGGLPIMDYEYPDEYQNNNGVMTIDPITGTVSWDVPLFFGEYNIAIRINEYRQGIFVGSVVRDMQITVFGCNNQPPQIQNLSDLCIVAGNLGSQQIVVQDPDGDNMDLEMFGEPFELDLNWADFNQTSSFNPAQGTFLWIPSCDEVRLAPYLAYVKATDITNEPTDLSDIDQFNVQVIAPRVENLNTTIQEGGDILLEWDSEECESSSGYKIYRRIGTSSFNPGPCQTGLPASAGYDLIETIQGINILSYLDTDVPYGSLVCYRVVACFPDGAESIVSAEVCDEIDRVKPAITQATVDLTGSSDGEVTLRWVAPLELDTIVAFTGPYSYRVSRASGISGFTEVFTTPETATMNVPLEDLVFVDTDLDTEGSQYRYRVGFLNNGEFISSSTQASTIRLTLTPLDNRSLLEWQETVPWLNTEYEVYEVNPLDGTLDLLTVTSESFYEHEGLTNGTEYCYVVKSNGMYSAGSGIDQMIENFSQQSCTRPIDLEAPCPPSLSFSGTCEDENYELNWVISNEPCNEDVTSYGIYYAPNDTADFSLLTIIEGRENMTFFPEPDFAVGCFQVTALDSLLILPGGMTSQNESLPSNSVCLESCPIYELPNVISPNGDGFNDLFRPFDPYRYVDSIDLNIYNRWGQIVFKTTDPAILWDGSNKDSGEQVSDGVYFYTVDIFERTLRGLVQRSLAGDLTIIDNRGTNTE